LQYQWRVYQRKEAKTVATTLLRRLRKFIVGALPKGSDQEPIRIIKQGFLAVLEDDRFEVLAPRLDEVEIDWRGFIYEGAGLGFGIFDYFFPWGKRLQAFVRGPGAAYIIPVYIGTGLALSYFHSKRPERFLARLENPTFRWMVLDGYGFHKGYFSQHRYLEKKAVPAHLSPYARRVFDQGLGRSIWFAKGENIDQVVTTIATFPEARRADLWSGVGSACSYAGTPMERQALEALRTKAGPYRLQLALGAAMAANRRHGFGHITPHTELACQIFCGIPGEIAAHLVNDSLENLPTDGIESPHKIWRERIEARLATLTMSKISGEMDVAQ
jgi:hypothetical protein